MGKFVSDIVNCVEREEFIESNYLFETEEELGKFEVSDDDNFIYYSQ
jgi:hypothetical protein